MRVVRPSPRWQSLVSALMLTAFLSACAGWQTVGPTPEVAIRDRAPHLVRLTFTDGPASTLRGPTLSGDSVIGELASSPVATPERQAFPLSAISAVAVRHTNALKTASLIVGGVIVIGLAQCAISQCLAWDAPY